MARLYYEFLFIPLTVTHDLIVVHIGEGLKDEIVQMHIISRKLCQFFLLQKGEMNPKKAIMDGSF